MTERLLQGRSAESSHCNQRRSQYVVNVGVRERVRLRIREYFCFT